MPAADKQTSLRLPSSLYQRLVEAATSEHSVGEEIRLRLEESFFHDDRTAELCGLVSRLAREVEEDVAPWHSDPYACQSFVAGLGALLSALKPEGEPTPREGAFTHPDDPPEVRGRTLARLIFTRREKR